MKKCTMASQTVDLEVQSYVCSLLEFYKFITIHKIRRNTKPPTK